MCTVLYPDYFPSLIFDDPMHGFFVLAPTLDFWPVLSKCLRALPVHVHVYLHVHVGCDDACDSI